MKLKKRKKNTRYRGSQTHFRGHRKRTRGLGNKGGVGMSGSENQKKSLIMNLYGPEYFGRDKALRRGKVRPQLRTINLSELIRRFDSLVKQGIAKQTPRGFEFNLKGYKLLASGGLNAKISVKASAASKQAIAQIKDAGGTLELEKQEDEESKVKVTSQELGVMDKVKEEKPIAKPAKKK